MTGCSLPYILPETEQDLRESLPPDAYTRGVNYYSEADYQSAVRELESVSSDHPGYPQAQDYLKKANRKISESAARVSAGLQSQKVGELFRAKKKFEEALALSPKSERARSLLDAVNREIEAAVNLNYEKGRREFEGMNYEEARLAYLEALKANPEESRVRTELSRTSKILTEKYSTEGTALFEKGIFDEAVKYLEQAYVIDSNDPLIIQKLTHLYNRRALKYYREEKLSMAILDLKRSLEIDSSQTEIQDQLEQVQKRLGLLKKIDP